MLISVPLLQNVRVASPCNASWEDMDAIDGERVKFCGGCKKNVYNLSAMSQEEAEGLLRKHEGHLCIRYYERRDGTILTADCPVGLYSVRMALIRYSVIAAGLFTLLLGAMAAMNSKELQPLTPPKPMLIVTVGSPIDLSKSPREPVGGESISSPSVMGHIARPIDAGGVIKIVPDQPYDYQLKPEATNEAILKPHHNN
jgi:hypothetical protein